MASGTIYGTCYRGDNGNETSGYQFYVEYSTGTPSVAGNYTPLTVTLKLRRNPDEPYAASAYNLNNQASVSLSIDGETVFSSTTADFDTRNAQIWTFTTKTKNVAHNADGSKTVAIKASLPTTGGSINSLGSATLSGSVKLAAIPRASSITSASDATIGSKAKIVWTPKAKSFYYKVKLEIGDWEWTSPAIHPDQTSAYTYTTPSISYNTASELPNATSGTMTATLYTYSDSACSKQVGSESSKTFKLTVPDNSTTKPTVTMTLAPVSSLGDAFDGLYIQGKTKVKSTLSAAGKYDATIKSYSMKVEGSSYDSGDSYTSDYLSQYGSITVYGYAKDSRGYTGSASEEITVIAYSKPKILAASGESDVVAARCNADGNLSNSGTYLKIKAKRSYSPVKSGGVQNNFCKIRFRYKLEGASSYSSWTTILAGDSLDSDEIVTGALLGGVLAATSTYLVQVQAIDDIGEHAYTTISVPTDKVYMHRDGAKNALAIGKYVEEENCIDIGEDIKLKIRGEKWVDLGISDEVSESTVNTGRAGKGCFYRVVNDNHVFVAFNIAVEYSGDPITVNAVQIPAPYKPARNAYALCTTNGRGVARVFVNTSGDVRIDHIQNTASGETTAAYTVNWIDAYIDYFV